MRAWLAITSIGPHQGLSGSERQVVFERALPAVNAMAIPMDPSFPPAFQPYVPLVAVAMPTLLGRYMNLSRAGAAPRLRHVLPATAGVGAG